MIDFFPVMLSQSYVQAMLLGEETVGDEFLVADFKKFLTTYKSNLHQRILTSKKLDADGTDFFLELQDRYGMQI